MASLNICEARLLQWCREKPNRMFTLIADFTLPGRILKLTEKVNGREYFVELTISDYELVLTNEDPALQMMQAIQKAIIQLEQNIKTQTSHTPSMLSAAPKLLE